MRIHPLADLYPAMTEDEFGALVADIHQNGLRQPILLHPDGSILDGRHRWRSIDDLADRGVIAEPRFQEWDGCGDLVSLIHSLNFHRRHLSVTQKACIGVGYKRELQETVKQGQRTDLTSGNVSRSGSKRDASRPREMAAAKVGVSGKVVDIAERISEAAPDLFADMQSGEKTVWDAERELKKRRQEARDDVLNEAAPALSALPSRYALLYADPPWRYDFAVSSNREIENQYPTMDIEDICSLPVPEITADDAVLFLWATSPKLTESLRVMQSWGFTYKTCMVWVKDKIGMGYYARQRHEILLIGTRGHLPTPEPSTRPDSVITAPRGKHSAKPVEAYELLEAMYPGAAKVEIFCRSPRDGWHVWGNQSHD